MTCTCQRCATAVTRTLSAYSPAITAMIVKSLCPGIMPRLMAISVSFGPTWVTTPITTMSTTAVASQLG